MSDQAKIPDQKKGAGDHANDRDMGSALRSIYQKTIEEKIPDEMLALLGKLD
ncbi:NepR family anti-sigma factor [Sphingomonas sp. TX0543]|uniref:NepR family anti-sigma factor n=1 Tax=unclassified Sphingomonas TaxID=196159 RepID=UPI002016873F|nr:NepR family anti-sigma factor [Sphingomonas sp. 3P27F8]